MRGCVTGLRLYIMSGAEMAVDSGESAIETAPLGDPRAVSGPMSGADRPPPTVSRPQSAVPPALRRYLSLDDFAIAARRVLPKMLYGYVSGGTETDAGVRDNRRAFD